MPEVTLTGDRSMPFPEHTESGNLQVALSAMSQSFAASASRSTARADQTNADASAMWSVHMTTPTTSAALGYRTATEAGAGRTRIEANTPASTQTVGG